jgi:hypothetical protein
VKKLLPVVIVIFVAATAGIVASCKQDDGERCQLNADCKSGLCNVAEHVCASTTGGGEEDANGPEAGIDAPVDTPSDAIDAATD